MYPIHQREGSIWSRSFDCKRENFCMNTQPNFEELLRLFEKNSVRYLIVGGYAVAFHGHPRFTKDIDVFYENTVDNVEYLRKALVGFGFGEDELPADVFDTGNIVKFGVEPVRIDLLNEIDGVSFEEAYSNSVEGEYGDVRTRYIGLAELIQNKRSSDRPQDAVDVQALQKTDQ